MPLASAIHKSSRDAVNRLFVGLHLCLLGGSPIASLFLKAEGNSQGASYASTMTRAKVFMLLFLTDKAFRKTL
jgi:hypothetical protein